MNKKQKLVLGQFLNNEEAVINRLEIVYSKSLEDINKTVKKLQDQIDSVVILKGLTNDPDELEQLKSIEQSKIYQKKYQESLKKQVSDILDTMQDEQFVTVSDYLQKCYEDGFVGTMFDLHGQGIPLCFPLDQEAMVRAVQLDSKIKGGLYSHLGEDVQKLKNNIAAEVSRGISTGMPYEKVARNISARMVGLYDNPGGSLAYAARIARTEGHRIQVQSGMDACYKAKDMGADVVKQWDSTLDKRTRKSHQQVDGEIRELDEPFSNGLMFPGDPDGGAAEVVNCRCALLQRAKWALDDEELETLKERAKYYGLDKAKTFDDFKNKYIDVAATAPAVKPKKEYLTKKKLEQNIAAGQQHMDDLDKKFSIVSGGMSYDDIIKQHGSLDGYVKGQTLKKLEDIKYQMDDLQKNMDDWTEKLDKKLVAAETKKLKKEQTILKADLKDLQDDLAQKQVKTYSGIWKDDVTTADYGAKKAGIQGKKDYFNNKIMLSSLPAEKAKWQKLLDDLDEFEIEGSKYYAIQQKIQQTEQKIKKIDNNIKNLKKKGLKTATTGKTAFDPDAYGQRKDDAWNNRFTDRNAADKYYRPLLDAEWNNLSDEEKFAVWQYTHNSHPINRPLSGYDGKWGSRSSNYKGLGGVKWDNESGSNYDAVLHSSAFKKFANAKSSTWGGDIRNYSDVISDLTIAIEKNAFQDDQWLVRGSGTEGLAGLLDSNIISYQQVESLINSGDIQTLKQMVQNQTFQTHSFTSTGIADGTGFGGNISYKIYAPKGTKGMYAEPQSYYGHTISGEELYTAGKNYSAVGGEAEIILQRGTSYRIVDIKSTGYGNIEVVMEVVDQPDYFKTGFEHTFNDGLTTER